MCDPITLAVVSTAGAYYAKDQRDKKKEKEVALTRSNAMQQQLNKQITDLKAVPKDEEAVVTNQRVTSTDTKKKTTIKSLNLPLNNPGGGTGLNT